MLISAKANLLFAHFPKTAGSSLERFLPQVAPDMRMLAPFGDKHISVPKGFRLLRRRHKPYGRPVHWAECLLKGTTPAGLPCPDDVRVLGVVREPFEMAVSLFEYWNRVLRSAHSELSDAAVRGDFRRFLGILAEESSRFPSYRQFFDQGGEAWPRTLLVDFAHLNDGLREAFQILGIKADLGELPRINAGEKSADRIRRREDEAGELAEKVRARYAWPWNVRLLGRP
jgi:hypothetical protein